MQDVSCMVRARILAFPLTHPLPGSGVTRGPAASCPNKAAGAWGRGTLLLGCKSLAGTACSSTGCLGEVPCCHQLWVFSPVTGLPGWLQKGVFFPTALKQKYPHLYESPSDIACGCSSREPSSSRQTSSAGGSQWYQNPPRLLHAMDTSHCSLPPGEEAWCLHALPARKPAWHSAAQPRSCAALPPQLCPGNSSEELLPAAATFYGPWPQENIATSAPKLLNVPRNQTACALGRVLLPSCLQHQLREVNAAAWPPLGTCGASP